MQQSPHDILRTVFGYEQFRLEQERAIGELLQGNDVFVLMPTGAGKSLCYQIPALLLDGLTVVVSPLIALMKDQVDALRLNGVAAAYLNSTLSAAEQGQIVRQMQQGKLKLLYVAPERLFAPSFWELLQRLKVALFAIDEAHCISQWGHDFRPEYVQLTALRQAFPRTPIIALTATADAVTRQDIIEQLHLQRATLLVSSFNRPNIRYFVEPKRDAYKRIAQHLRQRKGERGIIYALSRASVESLAERLRDDGFSALPYHAGLDRETRTRHQDLFLRDEVDVICATIAFGMGIDKSNVRFVIHHDLPKNIEGYYQETGRAGRDGLQSDAILLFSTADVMKLRGFCQVEGNPEQTAILQRKLRQMSDYCESRDCRRQWLLRYFGEEFTPSAAACGTCDVCLFTRDTNAETFDATIHAQKIFSAIVRTGERFAAKYIINLLRGNKDAVRLEHLNLKTFGVGADMSEREWRDIIRQLLQAGLLEQEDSQFYTLRLNQRSKDVLYNGATVMLAKLRSTRAERAERTSKARQGSAQNPQGSRPQSHQDHVFERLRVLRRTIADSEGVPAFVVFSDAVLVELAEFLPHSLEELRHISGFGAVKTAKYGEAFVQEIRAYCAEHNLSSQIDLKPTRKRERRTDGATAPTDTTTKSNQKPNETSRISLALWQQGKSVQEIAAERNLTEQTILGHLARFVPLGALRLEELVPPERIERISAALRQTQWQQGEALRTVKEAVGEDVSYGEIQAVINATLS